MPPVLVDSNVLIYSVDVRESAKRQLARLVLDRLTIEGRTAISVQCLTEFFSVTTQQFKELLTPAEAGIEVRGFAASFTVLDLTAPAVLEATRVAEHHSVPIWDALIWAVAATNGIQTVLTEDIRDRIEGVRFVNPFEPGFEVEGL